MTLRLTNTLTRRVEPFEPLVPGQVSIYCCGVTVYDLCHLGHARSYIAWDVLRRYLIWCGNQVTFVQNYTDIDDKILGRAAEEGSSMQAVSERNIEAFVTDMARLNILPPDRMPRATQSLDAIRSLITELEAKGAAYSADGDVYFAVMKHAGYGKLSGRDLAEQQDNAAGRVATAEEARKQHPFDFALWKGSKPGEPSWESPWGPGRPGWHIECSAMVREELGDTIDIHLGGADLIFPHHENEIAQSEAATGHELARYWLHNGMVNVGGQKMSKSLGNFTTIRALLDSGITPMTLRLFTLQAHYRKPLDFSAEALEAAATGWKGLNAALGLASTLTLGSDPACPRLLPHIASASPPPWTTTSTPPPPWRCCSSWPSPCAPSPIGWSAVIPARPLRPGRQSWWIRGSCCWSWPECSASRAKPRPKPAAPAPAPATPRSKSKSHSVRPQRPPATSPRPTASAMA